MRKEASSQIVRFISSLVRGSGVWAGLYWIYLIGKASTYFKQAKRHMLPSESSFLLEAYRPLSVYLHQVHMII